ncbi:MAG: hypothetical protein Q7R93_03110 [bacterium]|nr:hypothetical protein [bacterium]
MASDFIFEGKKFISSSQASKATGYASDYVGQLSRGGKIIARRIGKSWFVQEDSILSHKALALNFDPAKAKRLNGKTMKDTPRPQTSEVETPASTVSSEDFSRISASNQGPVLSESVANLSRLVFAEVEPSPYTPEISTVSSSSIPFEKFMGGSGKWNSRRLTMLQRALPTISSALLQKVGTIALSTALVFGSYQVKDVPEVRSALRATFARVEGAARIARDATLYAISNPDEVRSSIRATLTSLASVSEEVGHSLFASGLLAAVDVGHDFSESAALSLLAMRDMSDASFLALADLPAAVHASISRAGVLEQLLSPFKRLAKLTHDTLSPVLEKGKSLVFGGTEEVEVERPRADIEVAPAAPSPSSDIAISAGSDESPKTSAEPNRTAVTPTTQSEDAAGQASASGRPVISDPVSVKTLYGADITSEAVDIRLYLPPLLPRSGHRLTPWSYHQGGACHELQHHLHTGRQSHGSGHQQPHPSSRPPPHHPHHHRRYHEPHGPRQCLRHLHRTLGRLALTYGKRTSSG